MFDLFTATAPVIEVILVERSFRLMIKTILLACPTDLVCGNLTYPRYTTEIFALAFTTERIQNTISYWAFRVIYLFSINLWTFWTFSFTSQPLLEVTWYTSEKMHLNKLVTFSFDLRVTFHSFIFINVISIFYISVN